MRMSLTIWLRIYRPPGHDKSCLPMFPARQRVLGHSAPESSACVVRNVLDQHAVGARDE